MLLTREQQQAMIAGQVDRPVCLRRHRSIWTALHGSHNAKREWLTASVSKKPFSVVGRAGGHRADLPTKPEPCSQLQVRMCFVAVHSEPFVHTCGLVSEFKLVGRLACDPVSVVLLCSNYF